ncbi:MAG: PspC domain-containing protein [Myxococcales bacterium]|nr:PspC domain-containing protein [Myxococcales bacterium]
MARARTGLMRSREHRMLAGVCGGLADWLGWSPGLTRLIFVLVSILSAAFPGIIVYLILWIVMPLRDD